MWIVALALRRPYTFVVAALLLVVLGIGQIGRIPTDIFPKIDIPVITVVWTYGGMPSSQMEQQITQFSEFSLSGNVEDVRNLESQTFDGAAVIKLYFHEGVDIASATAQVTAISQTILRRMPVGTQPPVIVRYNASSVPILQFSFTSDTLSESEIYEHVNRRVRSAFSAVRGTRFPLPSGGRDRLITVDLDPDALRSYGLSLNDVNQAIATQNFTLPTGTLKLGETEYKIGLNSSPDTIDALNDMPIMRPEGGPLLVRDVAFVHDGFAPQTNISRKDGKRAVVLSVMKTGSTSTVEIAAKVRSMLPGIRAAAPPGLQIELLVDQSIFVTNAIRGLVIEGVIAALLTATMILIFLGSWRSTIIVAVSIPLSIIAALLVMAALGQTINVMTLGGLALAVGILVDDATVEIENIHRNLHQGKPLVRAILDGAQQVAVPAFVASLSIALVFLSVLVLQGPTRFLFLPMGMAVGFSVIASYILSRTLVPTMVRYLLPGELARQNQAPGFWARRHAAFERGFAALQRGYGTWLDGVLHNRGTFLIAFILTIALGAGVALGVGRDFFPNVDAGQIRLHITAPAGTRIEQTEQRFADVEAAVAELIPAADRQGMLSQIGLPSGYSLATSDTSNVSSSDGELLIRLSPNRQQSTTAYIAMLRQQLARRFADLTFYFQPADMATQILNFGLASPIDIQISGPARDKTIKIARTIETDLKRIAGVVDVRMHQVTNVPRFQLNVDRRRAAQAGLTQRDIANNVLLAAGSSGQVSPSYWTDPVTGQSYSLSVRVPEERMNSLDQLLAVPFSGRAAGLQLRDVATVSRQSTVQLSTRVNVQPTFNIRADIAGSDLGTVARAIDDVIAVHRKALPPGSELTLRGQIESMRSAFSQLGIGIALAALLVYCLMVINFQSWRDPLIIFMALPGAAIGIVCALKFTHTTFNVPSLMGAIMSIGVATANSILVVSFANDRQHAGDTPVQAALESARTRLRPVVMTALAMIIGMVPMALGHGDGAESNAALARAVIGGLVGATLATLFVVPTMYVALPGGKRRGATPTEDFLLGESSAGVPHE